MNVLNHDKNHWTQHYGTSISDGEAILLNSMPCTEHITSVEIEKRLPPTFNPQSLRSTLNNLVKKGVVTRQRCADTSKHQATKEYRREKERLLVPDYEARGSKRKPRPGDLKAELEKAMKDVSSAAAHIKRAIDLAETVGTADAKAALEAALKKL